MSMGVYINGMKMPTERESFNLTIKYNGTVLDTETGIQVAEAHELPPHGRLIDADEFFASLSMDDKTTIVEAMHINELLEDAPTIIPASEEGET